MLRSLTAFDWSSSDFSEINLFPWVLSLLLDELDTDNLSSCVLRDLKLHEEGA